MATEMYIATAVLRDLTPDLFRDITPSNYTWHEEEGAYFLNFEQTLTDNQIKLVRLRCRFTPQQEAVYTGAGQLVIDLTPIRDFVGTATTAQLTSAAKSLAAAQIGVLNFLKTQMEEQARA